MLDLRYSSIDAPMPSEVSEALQRALVSAPAYPDPQYAELKAVLAADARVGADRISLGNGADDLIDQLARILPGPFLIPTPAFSEFARAAERHGKSCIFIPSQRDGRLDLADLLAHPALGSSTVWIADPHNPTGGEYPPDQLEALFAHAGRVVLDEAYFEFGSQRALADRPRVMRLRTFSKALGLAGLRLGYLISDADTAARLERERPFFPLNCFAAAAGLQLPVLRPRAAQRVERIGVLRRALESRLRTSGYVLLPSVSNFLLLDLGQASCTRALLGALAARSICLLPPWDAEFSGLEGRYLRVVIRDEAAMDQLALALEAFAQSGGLSSPL